MLTRSDMSHQVIDSDEGALACAALEEPFLRFRFRQRRKIRRDVHGSRALVVQACSDELIGNKCGENLERYLGNRGVMWGDEIGDLSQLLTSAASLW